MSILERAFYFAEAAHGNQKYGNYMYSFHLWGVVSVAQDLHLNEDVIIACMLHDVLEDTAMSYNDVKNEFGTRVAEIVYNVTDELGKNRKERHDRTYPKILSDREATLVKICDRIANVEYSKLHDKKMFKMYSKEQEDFENSMTRSVYCNSIVLSALKMLGGLFV